MSLKAIHVIFIVASWLMTLFFGVWSWRQYSGPDSSPVYLAYVGLSIVALIGLLFYMRYFVKKLRHISYL
jgi:hypothetical protein